MLTPPLLITAGPTFEDIDDVRFLGNRSSGRLGLALARAAAHRGWETTLALGPVFAPPKVPSSVRLLRFRSTADLQRLLDEHWPRHNSLVMAAAIADYRPANTHIGKLRRDDAGLTLKLEPTPDLLAACSQAKRPDQYVVGFALEPADRLLESAQAKLIRKGLDAIVANPLETMDADEITAVVLRTGENPIHIEELSKDAFAERLLSLLSITDSQRSPAGRG
ncbi:MAG: hypothetical protein KAS72_06995 [Phycisphaerales bacterium]|nr:hypothetical protein [Phycisphaerales bacterium]